MDFESAAILLDLIAAIAAVFWLAGTVFVWTSARRLSVPSTGEVVVDAAPATIVRSAKALLQRGVVGSPLSRIALLESHPDALVWEGGGGRLRHAGSLRAGSRPTDDRTVVAYQLETSSGLVTAGHWLTALGGVAIIALYFVLARFALAHDHMGVRYQVIQMVQAVHFLWPPFLLAGLARAARNRLARDLERSLQNAGFDDDE